MTEILRALKIVLLVELAVFVLFGIFFTFLVDIYIAWFNWPSGDPTSIRFVGVIYLSLAFVTFLVYREKEWRRIEYFIILNILIQILGAIVQIIGVFLDGTGWAGGLNFGIQIVFFLALLYFYIQQYRQ
ncbi:MAG: hypothetical protein ACFE9S_03340 [Candidatus Hermodarchaeota archaeon]